MKAAQLDKYNGKLQIREVPEPEISGPQDVIVRIGGAGLCRTDLHIIEGIWKEKVDIELPYTLGHENAGWVEEVGNTVTTVKPGDPVIVHPVVTDGTCRACRRGEDMYCENLAFPGITRNGGFAEYLLTSERALIKLPKGVEPRDIAPHADAGITAYRVVRKAVPRLHPGTYTVIQGVGGLGHIGLQVLRHLSPTQIIAVDMSEEALKLAKQLGADHTVNARKKPVKAIMDLTDGVGVDVVIDFVAEGGAIQPALDMLRRGGTYYVVGYGGTLNLPTIDIIFREISIVGSLVGNYEELAELMTLAAQGKVTLHAQVYALDDINKAIKDLEHGRIRGRGVLIP